MVKFNIDLGDRQAWTLVGLLDLSVCLDLNTADFYASHSRCYLLELFLYRRKCENRIQMIQATGHKSLETIFFWYILYVKSVLIISNTGYFFFLMLLIA